MRGLVPALGGIRAAGGGGDGLAVAVGRLLVRGAAAGGGAIVAVAAVVADSVTIGRAAVGCAAVGQHHQLTVFHMVTAHVASERRMPDTERNCRLCVDDGLKTKS